TGVQKFALPIMVAVVPTATTRLPRRRAALPASAVAEGTRYGSAGGGSFLSGDETPAWRVTGTTTTPADTSEATSEVVKGRPALGISAEAPDGSSEIGRAHV